MLTKAGHEVSTAADGTDGISKTESEKPDLVLMDVVMPGMNGFQATRKITRAESTRHIPVVVVSTKSQETDRVWAERQGARAYFTKPVDERELLATIERLISVS